MKIIAIICEYNPFHNGHEYQIEALRRRYGEVGIVCIMSGNYTQRAESAICDKYTRAHAALLGGADLVLELPFPYSSAGAEFFASAGVHIADSLGCVDMLSFGSECGDIEEIMRAAKILVSDEFSDMLEIELSKNKDRSYALVRESVFERMNGSADLLKSPNNILAIEYCKALIRKKSKIEPITLLRNGDRYNECSLTQGQNPSASALRAAMKAGEDIAPYMPGPVYELYKKCGGFADMRYLERAIISHLRLCDPDSLENIAECAGGLGRRICDAAKEVSSLDELVALVATKKYTNAKIRRAILFSYFGIRENDIKTAPSYTHLLAANARGREILKRAASGFNIIVKPSDYKIMTREDVAGIELLHRADAVYPLFFEKGGSAYRFLTATPKIIT